MAKAWNIALFFAGWKRSGVDLGEVLKHARDLPAPKAAISS
ncbi:MAG: hypothetical protein ABSH50_15860 [Bryobacteraceae bacterium]|jgi:hypothetical protein